MSPDDTVTLDTEIDVSEATEAQKELYEQMAALFEERFDLFVRKNMSYGNSFITNGVASYVENPNRYDSPTHAVMEGLQVRIGDKRTRFNNQLNGGPELVGEDLSETAGDAAVYWFMTDLLCQHPDLIETVADVATMASRLDDADSRPEGGS